jgi:protein O-mannosyl-transferase
VALGLAVDLLLVIVTMLAYLPAGNGAPIRDDDAHLTKQELRSLEGLGRIWTQPGATQQYYPLVDTLFWVEHQLWADWPAGYHLLNILLHCASALLLVRILRRLEIRGAWLAAAIYDVAQIGKSSQKVPAIQPTQFGHSHPRTETEEPGSVN